MRMPTSLAAAVMVLFVVASAVAAFGQAQTYCNFEDTNQVTIQYNPTVKEEPRNGRVWSPGITLYVQTPLTLGGSEIPQSTHAKRSARAKARTCSRFNSGRMAETKPRCIGLVG